MKRKAQSMLEYVVLLGIVAAALAAMQGYFKGAVQAVVKIAADELGDQEKGAMEHDSAVDWVKKAEPSTSSSTQGSTTTTYQGKGAVTYDKDETATQNTVVSQIWQDKK